MGNCFSVQNKELQYLKKAEKTFGKIDKENKNCLQASDLEGYFGNYSSTATKILMREMDSNKNSIITKNQWMAYWQLVRRSGYKESQIIKELKNIEDGKLQLDFPNAKQYQSTQPRETVVQTIIDDMRKAPSTLPFMLQQK